MRDTPRKAGRKSYPPDRFFWLAGLSARLALRAVAMARDVIAPDLRISATFGSA
jgi:hypothetical protein